MYLALIFCCTIASIVVTFMVSKYFAKSPPSLYINIAFAGLIIDLDFALLGFVGDITNQSNQNIVYGLGLTALTTIFTMCAGRHTKT